MSADASPPVRLPAAAARPDIVVACCTLEQARLHQDTLLLPQDREHAAPLRHPDARARSLAGRALLRAALACSFPRSPGLAVSEVAHHPGGAPWLPARPDVFISVSHSGELAMTAVCAGWAVGIDVERIDPGLTWQGIGRRFFHAEEVADLERPDRATGQRRFFEYWTAKEAVTKALHLGLQLPLSSFRVPPPAHERAGKVRGTTVPLCVQQLDAAAGYCAALAWRDTEPLAHGASLRQLLPFA